MKKIFVSLSDICALTSPAFNFVSNGVCLGVIPTSPISAGAYTIWTYAENNSSSAITISSLIVLSDIIIVHPLFS